MASIVSPPGCELLRTKGAAPAGPNAPLIRAASSRARFWSSKEGAKPTKPCLVSIPRDVPENARSGARETRLLSCWPARKPRRAVLSSTTIETATHRYDQPARIFRWHSFDAPVRPSLAASPFPQGFWGETPWGPREYRTIRVWGPESGVVVQRQTKPLESSGPPRFCCQPRRHE